MHRPRVHLPSKTPPPAETEICQRQRKLSRRTRAGDVQDLSPDSTWFEEPSILYPHMCGHAASLSSTAVPRNKTNDRAQDDIRRGRLATSSKQVLMNLLPYVTVLDAAVQGTGTLPIPNLHEPFPIREDVGETSPDNGGFACVDVVMAFFMYASTIAVRARL